ncbi:MAG: ATP-binding protein [Planctomycetota bacterium]
MGSAYYSRAIEPRLRESLGDSPITLIHGPRQCGKTTLARAMGDSLGYEYFSFDDEVLLAAAHADPFGFVFGLPEKTILDEVQRVPEIFVALKSAVDRDRAPGRFLLTGSANVLLVPRLADSLAGRMEILRLHPLSQSELAGHRSLFLDRLFAGDFAQKSCDRLGLDLVDRVLAGGYPAALARSHQRRRAVWYRDYIQTLVQRDLRDLARIQHIDILPRLLTVVASHTASLLNVSDLAGPFQLSRTTIRDYIDLLRSVFLVNPLPPWYTNQLSRIVKASKIHIGDTGLASALLGHTASSLAADRSALGSLLETFVLQELRRQASGHEDDHRFFHYRDRDQREVDIVIERGAREVAGIEVKAGATVKSGDFRGLRKLRDAAGDRWTSGLVLYDGEATASFGDAMFAVPIGALWESS